MLKIYIKVNPRERVFSLVYKVGLMNYFSKKMDAVLLSLSIVLFVITTVFTLGSNQLITISYDFLSQKILHREFDLEKWLPTIQSLFLAPLLLIVGANAFIFPKYRESSKITLISVLLAVMLGSIVYTVAMTTDANVNSDLAAEYLLAKECFLEKSILPLGWHYSTEIYILGKHLISAPMFLFTDNLAMIKTLTSLFCCFVLFGACWYVLSKLSIEKFWVKLLVCTLIICPFSSLTWYVIQWGTFYVPHVVFSLFYVGLFLELVRQTESGAVKKRTLFLFYGLAFLSGLSTIRYILNFQFPLTLVMILAKILEKETSIAEVQAFWFKDKKIFYSVVGLFLGGFGYIANNLVLQNLYSFSEWNTIAFCQLGDVALLDIFRATLQVFGFQEGVSVMTPMGIVNLLVYVLLSVLVVFLFKLVKSDIQPLQKIFVQFFVSSFLFNIFIYLNTEFIFRYLVNILLLVIPCIAIMLSTTILTRNAKYAVGVLCGIVLIVSSFSTMQSEFSSNENEGKMAVRDFLLSQDYEFGYGTFWNANVFNYLTNGKIEMGNLDKEYNDEGTSVIPKEYGYDNWLTPKRYYSNDYGNKPIFLILSQAEYEASKDNATLQVGQEVYSDEYYKVFEYPSHQAFKESFSGNE